MLDSVVFVGSTAVGSVLVDALKKAGFTVAESIAEADAILVYCESQADLEDVYFDSKGLIQTAVKDSYFINLSASTPGFARELNAVALVSDLHVVEAPLMVKDPTIEDAFAHSSNLSCFFAGEEADRTVVRPLIEKLVDTVETTGLAGSAQLAHAACTIQRSARFVACMETDALYRAFSETDDELFRFEHEQGLITDIDLRLLNAVKQERFTGSYTIAMWMSELTAALMTADDIDLILPGTESCMHLLELLAIIGGASMSPAALSLVYGEETLCAKHGLDWTRAEQTYGEEHDHHDGFDHDHGHNHDDSPGNFGAYSSN